MIKTTIVCKTTIIKSPCSTHTLIVRACILDPFLESSHKKKNFGYQASVLGTCTSISSVMGYSGLTVESVHPAELAAVFSNCPFPETRYMYMYMYIMHEGDG